MKKKIKSEINQSHYCFFVYVYKINLRQNDWATTLSFKHYLYYFYGINYELFF